MTLDHGPDPAAGTGFAARLRAGRLAVGLTQAELAARAGIGVRTVRDLERGRSLRPQRTTVELLAGALGLSAPEQAAFRQAGRLGAGSRVAGNHGGGCASGDTWSSPAPATPSGTGDVGRPSAAIRLPAVGKLVGRDSDVAHVAILLTEARGAGPVTLVGYAGVGKTSLALTVAHRVADRYPGGVSGVVVTGVSTEGDIRGAIASVLDLSRSGDAPERPPGEPALLLVDAVDRAPGSAAGALRWLAVAAPAVRVLATGRRPVGIPGERVWRLASLEVRAR